MLKNIYLFLKIRLGKSLRYSACLAACILFFLGCAQGNRPSGGKSLWSQLSQSTSTAALTRLSVKPFDFKREVSDSVPVNSLSTAKIKSSDGAPFEPRVLPTQLPNSFTPSSTGHGPAISTGGGSVSSFNPSPSGNLGFADQPAKLSLPNTIVANSNLQLPQAKNLSLTDGASLSGTQGFSPARGGLVTRQVPSSNPAVVPSTQRTPGSVPNPVVATTAKADFQPSSNNANISPVNATPGTDSNTPRSAPRENTQSTSQAIIAGAGNSSNPGSLPLVLPDQNPGNQPSPVSPLSAPSQPPAAPIPVGNDPQTIDASAKIGVSKSALALTAGLISEPVEQFGEASNHPPGYQPTSSGQGLGMPGILVNVAAPDGTITTASYDTVDDRWPDLALKCFPDRPGNPDAPIFPGDSRPLLRYDTGVKPEGPWQSVGTSKVSACGQATMGNYLSNSDDSYNCRGYMRIDVTWSQNVPSTDGKTQRKYYRAEKVIGCENFENGQLPYRPLIHVELKESITNFEVLKAIPNTTLLLENE